MVLGTAFERGNMRKLKDSKFAARSGPQGNLRKSDTKHEKDISGLRIYKRHIEFGIEGPLIKALKTIINSHQETGLAFFLNWTSRRKNV